MSRRGYLLGKRCLDLSGGLIGFAVMALLYPFIAAAIKLNSRGPVFFVQERVTRDGRPFRFYKFRTMAIDRRLSSAEKDRINEMGGPHFKSRLDPRVTAVGRFLRKFSLDELPQFYNVVKGDMSLVGPRPPLKHEVEQYSARERGRLQVRAGMTGPWQVSGRSHIGFFRMVEMDLDYIARPSLLRDILILIRTIPAVLTHRGAW
jgi:lipopolysaccharide/colanic/teichoic acid biosynthesis glycosyltransferase